MLHACTTLAQINLCLRADLEVAASWQHRGCPFCEGGRLHAAHYRRKPRGLPEQLPPDDPRLVRYSFCCDQEGCRRRTTPPSLRFLGRRVYIAPIVVLLTSLVSRPRIATLVRELEIDRRTLARWRDWWLYEFSPGRHWRVLRAKLADPPRDGLPRSLLRQLGGLRPRPIRWLLGLLDTLTGGDNVRGL